MRRWEELRPEFDKRGVQVVTVSTDTPEELRDNHDAHGLQAIMLSDRDLKITDAFGLRNQGIHSGPLRGAEALPVPASLHVDREGRVLWMEKSENYQRRSGPEVVLTALRTVLSR